MSDIPASSSPCHAGRWRAATIACILVIAFGLAAGASMYEQFKAQVAHLQAQLKATPRIKYIAVLLDTAQAPAMLATFDRLIGTLTLAVAGIAAISLAVAGILVMRALQRRQDAPAASE